MDCGHSGLSAKLTDGLRALRPVSLLLHLVAPETAKTQGSPAFARVLPGLISHADSVASCGGNAKGVGEGVDTSNLQSDEAPCQGWRTRDRYWHAGVAAIVGDSECEHGWICVQEAIRHADAVEVQACKIR